MENLAVHSLLRLLLPILITPPVLFPSKGWENVRFELGSAKVKLTVYPSFNSNNITRDGAKQLAWLLKRNTPLEVLNLAHNRIEDDGALSLAEALASYNTNLTK